MKTELIKKYILTDKDVEAAILAHVGPQIQEDFKDHPDAKPVVGCYGIDDIIVTVQISSK